jgi:hypothetical protein
MGKMKAKKECLQSFLVIYNGDVCVGTKMNYTMTYDHPNRNYGIWQISMPKKTERMKSQS